MTFTEVMAIIIGGALGYWVIDYFLSFNAVKTDQSQKEDPTYKNDNDDSIENRWFEILEVSRGASKEEIALAYKKKISQYHPDKVSSLGPDLQALAEEKSKKINAAYDFAMLIKQH